MCECEIVFKGDYTAANRVEHHGLYGTREHKRWLGMKARCFYYTNKNKQPYAGSGIGVCKEWSDSFKIYHDFMGDPPFETASLDRIDSKLHYCPHNVRWADKKMQSRNRKLNMENKRLPGVRQCSRSKKFFAVIWIDNKLTMIKGSSTYDEKEAHQSYLKAKEDIHGVFYDR